ncbi:MAG TPA: YciI family protein [Aliidongia sp.]|uniref:YciI family protein n=1 Tax=Aliidongia sp. TaxID=1914230 RepID=UPI002DDCF183|nr:YciI family protein [Aliidongia sp.]HEV2674882.1 YciI family protein [Aliidongia sp.]
MIFAITCIDRADASGVRAATRPAHLEHLKSLGKSLVLAGPFLAEDGATPTGSFLLVEAVDKAAAEAVAVQDPYAAAGLFASVTVQAYRISFLNPPAA